MAELTNAERHILEHALTGGKKGRRVYRNHYAAGVFDADTMKGLVDRGLMTVGRQYSENGWFYHCTEQGADAVGLRLPRPDQPES